MRETLLHQDTTLSDSVMLNDRKIWVTVQFRQYKVPAAECAGKQVTDLKRKVGVK